MHDFHSSALIVVVAAVKVGYLVNVGGECIVSGGINFAGGVMGVQGRVHYCVQQVHLLGDGRLVRLGTFSDVLE